MKRFSPRFESIIGDILDTFEKFFVHHKQVLPDLRVVVVLKDSRDSIQATKQIFFDKSFSIWKKTSFSDLISNVRIPKNFIFTQLQVIFMVEEISPEFKTQFHDFLNTFSFQASFLITKRKSVPKKLKESRVSCVLVVTVLMFSCHEHMVWWESLDFPTKPCACPLCT